MKELTQSERALQITILLKVMIFPLLSIKMLLYRNHNIIHWTRNHYFCVTDAQLYHKQPKKSSG